MPAVVDAGPLYATADADDDRHEACRRVLSRGDLGLLVPALVVAEASTSSAAGSAPQPKPPS
jgi:predicted nucleic acid-binding protein